MSSPPIVIKFTGDAKDLEKTVSGLTSGLTGMASKLKTSWDSVGAPLAVLTTGLGIAKGVWEQTGAVALEYNKQIIDFSRNTGLASEEASRLVHATGEVGIQLSTVTSAFKQAHKEGIEVNIDSLARLADTYLSLEPGIQRTKFLLNTFGSAGMEMGKLLELGGQGVRDLAAATAEGMVITEESILATKQYEASLKEFNGQVQELKVSIGNELLPVMSKMLVGLSKSSEIREEANRLMSEGIARNREEAMTMAAATIHAAEAEKTMADATYDASNAISVNTDAVEENKEALKKAKEAIKEYEDRMKEMSRANLESERFMQSYADFQDSYADRHVDATDKIAEAEEKLRRVMAKDYGKGPNAAENRKNAISDAKDALNEAKEGIQELEAEWHEKTQRMIYDMVLAKLSVDGLTDAEFKAAQQIAVTMGIRTQAEADQAIAMMDQANAIVAGVQVQEDVMREKAAMDAELLELENAKAQAAGETTAVTVDGAGQAVDAVSAITQATEREIGAQVILQGELKRSAALYAQMAAMSRGIRAPTTTGGGGGSMLRDGGGHGIAGTPYMIGTGAQPEMFVPQTNGTFIPNADKMKGDTIYNIVVNNPKAVTAENSLRAELVRLSYGM